jgi:hypothetical protein
MSMFKNIFFVTDNSTKPGVFFSGLSYVKADSTLWVGSGLLANTTNTLGFFEAVSAGNTEGGSITVLLTFCLTGLD